MSLTYHNLDSSYGLGNLKKDPHSYMEWYEELQELESEGLCI